jgi:15-cis-phytoene synthase
MSLDLDPERKLALAYAPAKRRAALEALWRLDVAFGSVLATGREPMISQVRLAWWREALETLDRDAPPAEPVLQNLARHVLPEGIKGAELAEMEDGWAMLLASDPLGTGDLDLYAHERGARLFELSARLLGAADARVAPAGEAWALADLARRSGQESEVRAALDAARSRDTAGTWPAPLRPLGMLAALARRDAARGLPPERQGSPTRMLRLFRHRLTGL